MHASARRRRGRTYVQSLCRGGVRVETDHRPGQKLTEVHVPAAYVAADEVGVLPFEIRRPGDALRKNTVPETGGETFYLRLDPLGHVEGRAVWDVAVGPDQTVCLPSGARVWSKRLCWASSIKNLSGCSPRATAASPAEISSSVAPRWTVPARRHSSASQGIGPSSAKSTLNAPGP